MALNLARTRGCASCLQLLNINRTLTTSVILNQRAQKVDPIQQLFVDKVREYAKKQQAAGGKLVDSTPEVEANLKNEMERIERQFGAKGQDFTKFPEFKFVDPKLEPVGTGMKLETELQSARFRNKRFGWPDDKPYYEDVES